MGENTTIFWCDHFWNPWLGCDPVHTGCKNCYAQVYFHRMGIKGVRRRTSDANWKKPLKWNRQANAAYLRYLALVERATCEGGDAQPGEYHRPRVFPSLSDPFEDWQGPIVNAKGERLSLRMGNYIPCQPCVQNGDRWATMNHLRRDMFRLINRTYNLDWLLLTKRPENIRTMWLNGFGIENPTFAYRKNVHLLYSASDQESLEARIGHLLKCRDLVPVLGLSLEPLVRPVDLSLWLSALDWVIVGGESGPNARSCNLDWISDIIQQCKDSKTPCFVKQVGRCPFQICRRCPRASTSTRAE